MGIQIIEISPRQARTDKVTIVLALHTVWNLMLP